MLQGRLQRLEKRVESHRGIPSSKSVKTTVLSIVIETRVIVLAQVSVAAIKQPRQHPPQLGLAIRAAALVTLRAVIVDVVVSVAAAEADVKTVVAVAGAVDEAASLARLQKAVTRNLLLLNPSLPTLEAPNRPESWCITGLIWGGVYI
jgi:hypothetical protein